MCNLHLTVIETAIKDINRSTGHQPERKRVQEDDHSQADVTHEKPGKGELSIKTVERLQQALQLLIENLMNM